MATTELIKGTIQTVILKVLSDYGRMYGYEITQKVKMITNGDILLTEGSLYPHLHRMEAEGILSTETVHVGKRIRKYYKITSQGKNVVEEKLNEFASFIRTMQHVLNMDQAY